MKQKKAEVINKIKDHSSVKGFVTIDEITSLVENAELPLDEVDRLCEIIIGQGVLIRSNDESDKLEYAFDRSKVDYDSLFNKVIEIDPTLTPYINELRLIPPPQHREEVTIIHQAIEGNVYAKERIIKMYLKVVVKMALWFYEKYSLPLADTIQEGNIGIVLALKKISPDTQTRFSTYSPWWIRQAIWRFTLGLCKTFSLPAHMKEKLFQVIELKNMHDCYKCLSEKHCQNLVNTIMEKCGFQEENVLSYLNLIEEPESIEEYLEKDLDIIFSDDGFFEENVINNINNEELNNVVFELLGHLKDKQRRIIILRYGLLDGKEKTLEEKGELLKLTRERIRQIEAQATKRLLHPVRSKVLKSFY